MVVSSNAGGKGDYQDKENTKGAATAAPFLYTYVLTGFSFTKALPL